MINFVIVCAKGGKRAVGTTTLFQHLCRSTNLKTASISYRDAQRIINNPDLARNYEKLDYNNIIIDAKDIEMGMNVVNCFKAINMFGTVQTIEVDFPLQPVVDFV